MMFAAARVGRRHLNWTDRRNAIDFAQPSTFCPTRTFRERKGFRFLQDNLNTHKPASPYEACPAAEACRLVARFDWHYTLTHGSSLAIDGNICSQPRGSEAPDRTRAPEPYNLAATRSAQTRHRLRKPGSVLEDRPKSADPSYPFGRLQSPLYQTPRRDTRNFQTIRIFYNSVRSGDTPKMCVESITGNGEGGIRTLGTREGTTVFETAPIDRSGTSPNVTSAWSRGRRHLPGNGPCTQALPIIANHGGRIGRVTPPSPAGVQPPQTYLVEFL